MAIGLLATGSIYSLWYLQWKTNIKVYAFILYAGPGTNKVHALNLAARQLSPMDRAKIVRVIAKLIKVPQSSKYNGAVLYRIFKQYLPREIKKCYRTYFKQYITKAAIINYGLNRPEDMLDIETTFQNKEMFQKARNDVLMKLVNLYTGRGVTKETLEGSFAKPIDDAKPQPSPPTQPSDAGGVTQEPTEPYDEGGGEDSDIDGYY